MLLTELFESDTVAEEFTILGAGIYISCTPGLTTGSEVMACEARVEFNRYTLHRLVSLLV